VYGPRGSLVSARVKDISDMRNCGKHRQIQVGNQKKVCLSRLCENLAFGKQNAGREECTAYMVMVGY